MQRMSILCSDRRVSLDQPARKERHAMKFFDLIAAVDDPDKAQQIADAAERGRESIQSTFTITVVLILSFAIVMALVGVVIPGIMKKRSAERVRSEVLALIAEGKITADEAEKLMPRDSKS